MLGAEGCVWLGMPGVAPPEEAAEVVGRGEVVAAGLNVGVAGLGDRVTCAGVGDDVTGTIVAAHATKRSDTDRRPSIRIRLNARDPVRLRRPLARVVSDFVISPHT